VAGGLRPGWIAASGPVLERIAAAKRSDDIHSNTLSQLILARYLASGDYAEQAERARVFYAGQCAVLLEAIDEHLGSAATYPQPLGGGHVWVTLDMPLDERELVEEAARNGVACVPGGAMAIERRREVSLRLSFGYLEPEDLVEGVRRIAVSARALSRRPLRREVVPV
jgi:DNA-binding transcriptional MocR family regulator